MTTEELLKAAGRVVSPNYCGTPPAGYLADAVRVADAYRDLVRGADDQIEHEMLLEYGLACDNPADPEEFHEYWFPNKFSRRLARASDASFGFYVGPMLAGVVATRADLLALFRLIQYVPPEGV